MSYKYLHVVKNVINGVTGNECIDVKIYINETTIINCHQYYRYSKFGKQMWTNRITIKMWQNRHTASKTYFFPFLVVFSFFEKTTYCCRARRLSVRPSVEIIYFRGNSLPNRPIELKIGLNVREGVVHVLKA